MITKFILIMIITGGSQTGKTTLIQEFDSLKQCQYTYKVLKDQMQPNEHYGTDRLIAGGCFEK